MTVAKRLYLMVGAAILGLLVVAGVGMYQLERTYTAANYANVNTVPSLLALAAIRAPYNNLRTQTLIHVIAATDADMREIERNIASTKAKMNEAIKVYDSNACGGATCIADDKEKGLFADVKARLQEYEAISDEVVNLSKAHKNEEALSTVHSRLTPTAAKVAEAFNAENDYNAELSNQGAENARAAKTIAVTISIGASLLIIVIVGFMGFLVVRNLQRTLGGEPAEVAAIANKIADGDLNNQFALQANDNGSLMLAMKNMNDTLRRLITEMNHMSSEHDKGDIDIRIDESKFNGAFKEMASGVNNMVFGHIAVKKKAMACIKEFGEGNFDAQLEQFPGKKAFINNTIEQLRSNTKGFIADMNHMSAEHDKGDIDVKIDESKFQGDFRKMAAGVNNMVFGHIAVKKKAMACIKEFGEGNLDAPMEKLPGKKAFINDTIEQLRGNLKQIVGEIRDIVASANKGDFSVKMDMNGKAGFTKELSVLLNQLSDTVDTAFKDTIQVSVALEQGDLTQTVTRDYQGAFDQVKQSLNNTVSKLSQVIGEVNAAAIGMASASEEISATAQSMAQATNEQAASVEETSASVEQMGASINQNSENAKVTDSMASQAAKQATEGGVAVKETVSAMKQIAGKIGIIDDIAYQTNLLALNAAIEAARAGEHGKGFAVVAAEVRKLAERSQVAAQEIGELASGSVSKAEQAGKLLDEIVPAISKTSDLVQEITAASEEQSSGAAQINTAMSQLNSTTQQNASSTEELAATAEEMSGQAEQLQQLMSFFRVDGDAPAVKKNTANASVVKPVAKKTVRNEERFPGAPYDEAEFVKF